ncbi:MAG: carbohydrate kinase [Acidobacteria bacterium]|nr:carbohydrate kinase [Acidobacteriota bacterium]
MTAVTRPRVFGTGLIALDLVVGPDPDTPVRSWTGGTCGNVLSILAYLGWDAYPIARMNDDVASNRVRADMRRWRVFLDWANCAPTTHTPIVVQELRPLRDRRPDPRFSWSCPHCGQWLPAFRAITLDIAKAVKPALADTSVFFLDRLSPGALALAAEASNHGAVVVLDLSSKVNERLMARAISITHIVKYANDRVLDVPRVMESSSAVLLEIQTLGGMGLKYRHRFNRSASNWMHLNAVPAPRLMDTCGCGDWCTAGLIAEVAARGREGLLRAGASGVRAALRYGQALAAWNCMFEGARGGMYAIELDAFKNQIDRLLSGHFDDAVDVRFDIDTTAIVTCPACTPESTSSG